ncbi:hypothetical protein [Streptomyces noursei]|uniref:hypothetical protein n=1 Tax=Streptomyces noursei TaxID=1971 RepID=UPI0037F2C449
MSSGTTAPAVPLQDDEGHGPEVGDGPHPWPRPRDGRCAPGPLAHGDRRDVVGRHRCWTREAIAAPPERRIA